MSASGTWQPIIDGRLWEAERLSGAGFPLRTVALELPGGGTCVISPTRGIDPAPIVERAGDVRYLLAPNHFHYMGIAPWLEKCPRALPVCGPVARPRLTKKVEIPWTDLEELAAANPLLEEAHLARQLGELALVVGQRLLRGGVGILADGALAIRLANVHGSVVADASPRCLLSRHEKTHLAVDAGRLSRSAPSLLHAMTTAG